MGWETRGYDATRSKLAYGRVKLMVCPPKIELPKTNEKLAFLASNALCCVSLSR